MRVLALRNSGVVWLTLMAGVMAPASEAVACGYDKPAVGFARRFELGLSGFASCHRRDIEGSRGAAAALGKLRSGRNRFVRAAISRDQDGAHRFAELLRAASSKPSQPALFPCPCRAGALDPLRAGRRGLHAKVHVASAEPGDLVLVTGEAVISEIALGRLTIGEAARAASCALRIGEAECGIHRHLPARRKHPADRNRSCPVGLRQ